MARKENGNDHNITYNEPSALEMMKITVIEVREIVNRMKQVPLDSDEFETLDKEYKILRNKFDELSEIALSQILKKFDQLIIE